MWSDLEVEAHSRAPLQSEAIPLLASLLSVPLPDRYPPLTLTPQRQKQKTLEALLAWLLKEAERQPVLAVWEDVHWADPSTLELLTLQSKTSHRQVTGKSKASRDKSEDTNTQHPTPSTHAEAEAEACFHKAIEIARRQQAKSLELRAVMSLSRLWQKQGKREEARQMLAEIYGWFTEGFATADL